MQVESSMACNLQCIMCPWVDFRRTRDNRGIMKQEVWDAILPHLAQAKSIDFTGGGEPLLQPRLVDWLAQANEAGCETGLLTNGLLLRKELAAELTAAGINWICVSLDGADAEHYEKIRIGSNFEQVCENLSALAELRKGPVPKTMINFLLMRLNSHQVEEIVRLAARLGVDQVNFKQCDVSRGEHGKDLGLFGIKKTKEVRRLEKELTRARSLARKLGVATTVAPFTPRESPVCDQDPRSSLFIGYDGSVAPCINVAIGGPTAFLREEVFMPTVHYGRIPGQDLMDLWEAETCGFYRERFQSRVRAYEDTFVKTLARGSRPGHQRLMEAAVRAMPEAPEGCKVCHYLYDL